MGKRREAKRNRCHTVARIRSGVACCKISGREGLASMQDLKDDTSLCTRSSASHEACECCPTRGQACTPANPKPRQGRELMPAGRDSGRLARLVRRSGGAWC